MQAEQITKLKEEVQKIRHEKEELLIRYDLFSKQKMTEIPQTQIIILTNKIVVSAVSLSLSHWYPGSGVVLDCIDS